MVTTHMVSSQGTEVPILGDDAVGVLPSAPSYAMSDADIGRVYSEGGTPERHVMPEGGSTHQASLLADLHDKHLNKLLNEVPRTHEVLLPLPHYLTSVTGTAGSPKGSGGINVPPVRTGWHNGYTRM